jgi:hypothetical protein
VRWRDFINAIAGSSVRRLANERPSGAAAKELAHPNYDNPTTDVPPPMFDQRLLELGYIDGQNLAEE